MLFCNSRTWCWIVAYWNCDLLSHSIANYVDRHPMTVRRMWNWKIQASHTKRRPASQQPAITNRRQNRSITYMSLWILQSCHEQWVKKWGLLHDKSLHEQFNYVYSSMDFHFGNHGFRYRSWYITERTAYNCMFNNKPGGRNAVTTFSDFICYCWQRCWFLRYWFLRTMLPNFFKI